MSIMVWNFYFYRFKVKNSDAFCFLKNFDTSDRLIICLNFENIRKLNKKIPNDWNMVKFIWM